MKTINGTCPYCSTKIEVEVLDDRKTYSETPCCFRLTTIQDGLIQVCTDYPKSIKSSEETLEYLIQAIEKIKNEKTNSVTLL